MRQVWHLSCPVRSVHSCSDQSTTMRALYTTWRTIEMSVAHVGACVCHQWAHIIPVLNLVFRDKYVTRQEYEALREQSKAEHEQLKRRLDHLESMVSRVFSAPPGVAVGVPSLYPMPPEPSTENVASYHGGSSSHSVYPPSVPPSVSYHAETTPKHHYYPTASPPMIPEGASQVSTSAAGSSSHGHMRRPSDGKSPTQPRQSPLSLASITSPYNPVSESKNWVAQTLKLLGERLRLSRGGWKGPVVLLCDIHQRWSST